MGNVLKLEVAQHPISLRLSDAHFFRQVAKSYRGFLSDRDPRLVIEIHILDKVPPAASPSRIMICEGRGFRISDTSFSGNVNFERGEGNLYTTPEWLTLCLQVFLRNVFISLLLQSGGLALHAVGVLREKGAYVLFGPSGAGKTTAANLSQGFTILSDDLVLLRPENGSYWVHPTPAWGNMQRGEWKNHPYLLKAVFKLIQSQRIAVRRCKPLRAISDVITFPPMTVDVIGPDELLKRFSFLVKGVPFYELHFVRDHSFWPCLDRKLRKIGIENAIKNPKRGSIHGKQDTR